MNSIDGLKTCRKGLHQYPEDKKYCPACKKVSKRLWLKQNREQFLERNRLKYRQNPDQVREKNRLWRKQNPERVKENNRRWREQNIDKERENNRNWKQKNQDKHRALNSKWRAQRKQATPPWADHAAINLIYTEALRLEKKTGIPHHVDHIYPLNSAYMCGLHVAENLQILTGSANCSKSNRRWPGQLECQLSRNPLF